MCAAQEWDPCPLPRGVYLGRVWGEGTSFLLDLTGEPESLSDSVETWARRLRQVEAPREPGAGDGLKAVKVGSEEEVRM